MCWCSGGKLLVMLFCRLSLCVILWIIMLWFGCWLVLSMFVYDRIIGLWFYVLFVIVLLFLCIMFVLLMCVCCGMNVFG